MKGISYLVFISHAGQDTWVARQLSRLIKENGGQTFLDYEKIEAGANFNTEILSYIKKSRELLALLTPWALDRPYVWMEIGGALTLNRRIVVLLHGLTPKQIQAHKKNMSMLTDKHLIELNDADKYLKELKNRISARGKP